jgi:hypothetical protein
MKTIYQNNTNLIDVNRLLLLISITQNNSFMETSYKYLRVFGCIGEKFSLNESDSIFP